MPLPRPLFALRQDRPAFLEPLSRLPNASGEVESTTQKHCATHFYFFNQNFPRGYAPLFCLLCRKFTPISVWRKPSEVVPDADAQTEVRTEARQAGTPGAAGQDAERQIFARADSVFFRV